MGEGAGGFLNSLRDSVVLGGPGYVRAMWGAQSFGVKSEMGGGDPKGPHNPSRQSTGCFRRFPWRR